MELGFALARRIELAEAHNVAALALEILETGGGIASFAGPTSPTSHAIGVGMTGPVTDADIDRLEEFYRARGTTANLDFCPLADLTLMDVLGRRPYRITEFNNVLVNETAEGEFPPGVRIARRDEQDLWTRTLFGGFFEKDVFTEEEIHAGQALFGMDCAAPFLAEMDGKPVAAAAACVRDGLLLMFGDATLVQYRKLGLHSALIKARLAWGAREGVSIATACVIPGSNSQRNYLKSGFRVIYTKMNMCRTFV